MHLSRTWVTLPLFWIGMLSGSRASDGASSAPQGADLENEVEELRERDAENRRRIEELERALEDLKERREGGPPTGSGSDPTSGSGTSPEEPASGDRDEETDDGLSPLDRALLEIEAEEELEEPSPLDRALAEDAAMEDDIGSAPLGPATLRLIDISGDLLFAVGSSTARDEELQAIAGGEHAPRKRGFTLQALELSLTGAVDPYFNVEAHLLYFIDPLEGESRFELEEAFLVTTDLPFGLDELGFQIEAGQFLTEFGRINPRHPHAWSWLGQPVVVTRFFGPDGLRGAGARLGWLTPLPWFAELHLGVQNAAGETAVSFLANEEVFEERPPGGRPFVEQDVRNLGDLVYLARLDNSWDLSDTVTAKLGASSLFGPNATGPDGTTLIYGADVFLEWQPLTSARGWPFVSFQSEIMKRDYRADDLLLPGDELDDWGLYAQVLWGFVRNWAAGVRYEFATGSGASVGALFPSRSADPFRDDRHRVAPLLLWQPTHFSRIRLQYNFDHVEHLDDDEVHSVWLGFEVLFGSHPAHTY